MRPYFAPWVTEELGDLDSQLSTRDAVTLLEDTDEELLQSKICLIVAALRGRKGGHA
jgi:hypothetical protein